MAAAAAVVLCPKQENLILYLHSMQYSRATLLVLYRLLRGAAAALVCLAISRVVFPSVHRTGLPRLPQSASARKGAGAEGLRTDSLIRAQSDCGPVTRPAYWLPKPRSLEQ